MAGNYPDYINNRMAYHLDGTVGVGWRVGGSTTVLSAGQLQTLNNESDDFVSIQGLGGYTSDDPNYSLALVFPEARDLSGFFTALSYGGSSTGDATRVCETSTDTTNGIDGTWTAIVGQTWDFSQTTVAPDSYRESSAGLTNHTDRTGIVGIRWRMERAGSSRTIDWDMKAVHLFGRISAATDRLELWHPTLDQRVGAAYFDWGNAERASTAQIDFRVKNLSGTKTAGATAVTLTTLTDSASAFDNAHTFSDDGGTTWLSSLTLASIAPGAISPVYKLRRVYDASQPLSTWAGYISAIPGTYA
jgi:hypothetical protein